MSSIKKIVICEDHPIYAKGMEDFLQNYFKVIGNFNSGNDTISFLKKNECDLLVLDLNLPDMNGLDIIKQVQLEKIKVKIVIVSMYNDKILVEKCKKSGVNAYCSKHISNKELLEIIGDLKDGKFLIDSAISKKIKLNNSSVFKEDFEKKIQLTSREEELIKLFSEGLSSKEIAEKLYVSSFTINTHKKNIYKKLNISSTAELVKFYYENL